VSFAFWAWIVVAVVCGLAECVSGGLYTFPWGVGALAAATVEAIAPGSGWQWAAFVCVSSAVLIAAQRLIVRRRK
jgi:membrane protein implicated in regulation of membrane protease activity